MTNRSPNPLVIFCAILLLTCVAKDCFAQEIHQLKILSYNVHHCRGLDEKIDLPRIAKIIKDCDPDFVALQEIDNKTRRCGGVDQAAELGRLTGLHAQFFKAIDFDGGQYGQAILSRNQAKSSSTLVLPNLAGREQRIVGIAEYESNSGTKIQFCTVHLDHAHDALRLQQADKLNEHFSKSGVSTIIAGDFNARTDSTVMQRIGELWTNANTDQPLATFPAERPTSQIDFIVFRPKGTFQTQSVEVLDQPMASDHRPIFAKLRLE